MYQHQHSTPSRQAAKTPSRVGTLGSWFLLGDVASWRLGVVLAVFAVVVVLPFGPVQAQEESSDGAPSLDELLGTDDEPGEAEAPEPQTDPEGPELSRELERRLSGREAADQFAQAVQDMAEAAARLGEERDAGIDTQRLQDEIILKLEQIIASAQNSEQQSSSSSSSQQQQQARQADRGGQPQPGQPQPGEQQGEQEGQQPGEGEQPGEGQQPGDQPGGQPSDGQSQRGDVRNTELSMEELREGEWGNLPPRLRDELAESLGESFNPVYRAITEAYYRRIAELSRQEAEGE